MAKRSKESEEAKDRERMRRLYLETNLSRDCEDVAYKAGHCMAAEAGLRDGRKYRFRISRFFDGNPSKDDFALTWRVQVEFRHDATGDSSETILPTGLTHAAIVDELDQCLQQLRGA